MDEFGEAGFGWSPHEPHEETVAGRKLTVMTLMRLVWLETLYRDEAQTG